jgi:hypothetical protein
VVRARRRWPLVLLLCALLLAFPAVSYARALTAPGGGGWQVRTVEWIRDNGGASLVTWIENWYYADNVPTGLAPDPRSLPPAGGTAGTAATGAPAPAPAPVTVLHGAVRLPGEGRWVPGRRDPAGVPAIYTTFLRPDAAHPSVVAGAAWMRADDTTLHLVAGTEQPGGTGWPDAGQVPAADVPFLVATFNSGWKFKDISGGFFLAGRTGRPLTDGQASVVIDDAGQASVGAWGRDARMSVHVRAVRQNLSLVVDNGRPVAGLETNTGGTWGSARNQFQYTWRSGLGTDAHGNLVYVAGNQLTLQTLAQAMADAGIRRGMELDIHPDMTSFASWSAAGGSVRPSKLLPDMHRPADRYLAPDQRDFFFLTLR